LGPKKIWDGWRGQRWVHVERVWRKALRLVGRRSCNHLRKRWYMNGAEKNKKKKKKRIDCLLIKKNDWKTTAPS